MNKKVIAVDIGASSGKMAFGEFDGSQLLVREYRDFANLPGRILEQLYIGMSFLFTMRLLMEWHILKRNMGKQMLLQ